MNNDEYAGQGGRYEMREGKRVRIEESAKDHPEGNTARDAKDNVIVHASSEQIAAREKAAAAKPQPAAAEAPAASSAASDAPDFISRKKGAN